MCVVCVILSQVQISVSTAAFKPENYSSTTKKSLQLLVESLLSTFLPWSLTPGNYDSSPHFHNFVISRVSCKWNHAVCNLCRLIFFTQWNALKSIQLLYVVIVGSFLLLSSIPSVVSLFKKKLQVQKICKYLYTRYTNIYIEKKPQTPRLGWGWGRSPGFLFAQVTAPETQGRPSADAEAKTWKMRRGEDEPSAPSPAAPSPQLCGTPSGCCWLSPCISVSFLFSPLFLLAPCVSICLWVILPLFLKPQNMAKCNFHWVQNLVSVLHYSVWICTCFQLHNSPPSSFSPQDFLPHNMSIWGPAFDSSAFECCKK